MKDISLHENEKALFGVRRKMHYGVELNDAENKVLCAAKDTFGYLIIYDETERTNRSEMFYKLYLQPKNHGRTLLSIASEVGCDVRSLIRYKKKLLGVFECVVERMNRERSFSDYVGS